MQPDSSATSQRPTSDVGPTQVAEMFETASFLHRQGQLAAARAICVEILDAQGDHSETLNMLGVLSGQSNDLDSAVQYFDQAIVAAPANPAPYCNRGLALKQLNRLDAALASFDQAITLNEHDAVAHYSRGTILQERGRFEDATASYDTALSINPNLSQAWFNRGISLLQVGRWDEALTSYDQAIRTNANHVEAYANKAALLHQLKRFDAALVSYDLAIALAPNYAAAYLHRGNVLKDVNQLEAALVSYDKAIEIHPSYAEAYSNRGIVLYDLNRVDESLDSYGKAIALQPDRATVYFNRASVLRAMQRFEDAAADFARAAELDPDISFLSGTQIEVKMQNCDWRNFDDDVAKVVAAIESGQPASHPFGFLSISNSARLQKKCAEIWVSHTCPADDSLGPIVRITPQGKIRVAYFSADFREHPVSRLLVELIERHDRSRFEVFGFSFGAASSDEMTERLAVAFDKFIEVRHKSNLEVASLARALGIDIAVDLGGYTHNSRPNVFALRAAPVQMSYLGYLGTMGAPFMDYLIADTTIVPVDSRQYYSEKIVYLPSYQANDSSRRIGKRSFTRRELGLPETGFVFSCFNTNYKITPAMFAVWMRILRRVHLSVLFVYSDNQAARRNLIAEAELAGIDQKRIVFGGRLGIADYLARYRTMDLFLDTLPYNAGTTASDALWAGLPVLTCTGQTFASRVAASLLTALGLPDLVTVDLPEYEETAVALGSDPEHFSAIKQRLVDNRLTKRLFNQEISTRHLEGAYTQAHRLYQTALPPDHIIIDAD